MNLKRREFCNPARGLGRLCLLLWLAFTLGASDAAAKTAWASFRPKSSAGRRCIHVGGKDLRYYKLDARKALTFTLNGPNRVRLLTRHLPVNGPTGKRDYTLRVMRDGKEILRKAISARRSSSATICDHVDQAVGVARKSYITVPKGKHTFRVYVEDQNDQVAVRLFKQKKIKEITLVSFTPDEYERVCTLVLSNGKEYPHYHFTRANPLRFTVIGPTALSLWSRPDFDQTMIASVSYGLEVLRNGESVNTIHYDGVRKLSTAVYKEKECDSIVPGDRKKLAINVPRGTWTYELRPTQPGPEMIAARILIPKKDLGNGHGR